MAYEYSFTTAAPAVPAAPVATTTRAQQKRLRRNAQGGPKPFPMGSTNGGDFTAMLEKMKATQTCIETAMATPMETCLKGNGVTFTLVTPEEPTKGAAIMGGPPPPMGGPPPPMGGKGFEGVKPGHFSPVQGL